MKKFLMGLGLVLLSQQSLAVTTVAGIDFLNIADTLDGSEGGYTTNWAPGGAGTEANSVVDGNGASWVYSNDTTATLDVSFTSAASFNIADVDLSILFVGDAGHSGIVTLLGGTLSGSSQSFNLGSGAGYTGYNSSTLPPGGSGGPTDFGIFATSLDLSGAFGSGTFSGIQLDFSDASAVPSLVGTISSATVVPVPAAVWLFGSGLIGLVGLAKRKQK